MQSTMAGRLTFNEIKQHHQFFVFLETAFIDQFITPK